MIFVCSKNAAKAFFTNWCANSSCGNTGTGMMHLVCAQGVRLRNEGRECLHGQTVAIGTLEGEGCWVSWGSLSESCVWFRYWLSCVNSQKSVKQAEYEKSKLQDSRCDQRYSLLRLFGCVWMLVSYFILTHSYQKCKECLEWTLK